MAKTKPAEFAVAVTVSDSVDIDFQGKGDSTRALWIGSGGDVSVEMSGSGLPDATVVFISVLSGSMLPIGVTRVNLTGTTADSIVALW